MSQKSKEKCDREAFDRAAKILPWNRKLLNVMGVWPKSPSIVRFGIAFLYYLYCLSLIYLSFFLALGHFMKVLRTLSEIITFTQVFYRLVTLKRYNAEFGEMLDNMQKELAAKNYRTNAEKNRVLYYNQTCKTFCKILVYCLGCTVFLYYLKPLIRQLGTKLTASKDENVTFAYELPQRFYSFYKIDTMRTYALTYLFQAPFAIINNFTQASMDCLTLTVTYHLCGQLAVLSLRIQEIGHKPVQDTNTITYYVQHHQRLLRIGDVLASILKSCLLVHLVGASVLICILVYNILMMMAVGQKTGLLTFFVYGSLNVTRLYAHCLVGECLIHESVHLTEAYYSLKWYELSITEQKLIILCLQRSQKPLRLMAGKFGTMSLSSFGEVMKTAMAYLSVLRSVI